MIMGILFTIIVFMKIQVSKKEIKNIVGYLWGPSEFPGLCESEDGLQKLGGKPPDTHAMDWFGSPQGWTYTTKAFKFKSPNIQHCPHTFLPLTHFYRSNH